MFFVPHRHNYNLLKCSFETWSKALVAYKTHIDIIEKKFMGRATTKWGDIDTATETIALHLDEISDLAMEKEKTMSAFSFEQYDIQHDLLRKKLTHVAQLDNICNLTKKPFLLDMENYHAIRRNLNNEQQSIVKEIVARKKNNPSTPFHLFLTGGAGTGKTHTAKIAYDALLHFYDKEIGSDPLKKKVLKLYLLGRKHTM